MLPLYLRNGIKGTGSLILNDNSIASITGTAEISGTGVIQINDNSILTIAAPSTVGLLSDKTIQGSGNSAFHIEGTINTHQYQVNGNASITFNGTLSTLHTNGVKGALNTSRNYRFWQYISRGAWQLKLSNKR